MRFNPGAARRREREGASAFTSACRSGREAGTTPRQHTHQKNRKIAPTLRLSEDCARAADGNDGQWCMRRASPPQQERRGPKHEQHAGGGHPLAGILIPLSVLFTDLLRQVPSDSYHREHGPSGALVVR